MIMNRTALKGAVFSVRDIKQIIEYLADNTSDPVQAYIMQKEIFQKPLSDSGVTSAYEELKQSKWYLQLAGEQQENGAFGRFHSMDARIKDKRHFVSTEAALRRARELSLSQNDSLVQKTVLLMERYLRGEEAWPDYTEKHHDNGKTFSTAFPYLIAANLSLFDPDNPLLNARRDTCVAILGKAFVGGAFDEEIWEQTNRDYTGICMRAWMVYPLWLLQNANCLDDALQRRYLNYIWNREKGIYYISNFAPAKKFGAEDKAFTTWLMMLETLSGFSLFPELMECDARPHLMGEIDRLIHDGTIKLPPPHPISWHYAESWRNPKARKVDMILRMTRLLVKCK